MDGVLSNSPWSKIEVTDCKIRMAYHPQYPILYRVEVIISDGHAYILKYFSGSNAYSNAVDYANSQYKDWKWASSGQIEGRECV